MISRLKPVAQFLQKVPAGYWLLSRVIGVLVPYTGSMGANIAHLGEGEATVTLSDRWKVRNHLSSVHALALSNLGELTANLALATLAPEGGRFIVTRLETDYVKKARGVLECRCAVPADLPWETVERTAATAEITDGSGDVVARVTVYMKLGIKRPQLESQA